MLSRVADSIYWMNRYVERAENVARFIDVNLYLTLDLPSPYAEQWEPLVATTGDTALFRARYGEPTRENVIRFLATDPGYPNSILASLRAARENARSVREAISSEMWQQVNGAYLMVAEAASSGALGDAPHDFFTAVKNACRLFAGLTYATMTHNEGWHFGRLGRLLERADKTSRIIDVKYFVLLPDPSYAGTPYDDILWAALLKSASALEMYRKRHGRIAPASVLEFLLFEAAFPRSLAHCVTVAEQMLWQITGALPDASSARRPAALLAALRDELANASIDDLVARGMHQYLDGFQHRLNDVGEAVFETFFALEPDRAAAASSQ